MLPLMPSQTSKAVAQPSLQLANGDTQLIRSRGSIGKLG